MADGGKPADARVRRAPSYENPRPDVQALVPLDAMRILDLGCSSGALGAALKNRQSCEVVGVELDAAYSADAERRLDRVFVADVEALMAQDSVAAILGTFDCVVAADVLEHLRDPWSTLRAAARLIAPGGRAVVSLPNVRYWETFRAVGIRGTWPSRDEGIFDRTHLRWFALRDAYALLDQAALDVVEVTPQYRLRPAGTRWDRRASLLGRTPLRPFFAFQYVLAATPRTSS